MALLGQLIDKTSLQTLGGAAGANFFQTVAHAVAGSYGATNPDTGLIVARSIQAGSAAPSPYWFGANASLATLGLAVGSAAAASAPMVAVDCFNVFFWQPIR